MNYAERILKGDMRAVAKLLRKIDDRDEDVFSELKVLFRHTGKAYIIGITGNPGSGKSTLVDLLISEYRKKGLKVGVLAIDPSSPFTGGAILGDRIRMKHHFLDSGVFIRSLATRGHLGGLTLSTADSIVVLDAYGCDVIIIETVGVGQDEIEIVDYAHTSIVVLVPGLGDEIQAIKAGILEIADIFVINKSDKDGSDKVYSELRGLQELIKGSVERLPEIVKTSAAKGSGIKELVEAISRHKEYLLKSGKLREKKNKFVINSIYNYINHKFFTYLEHFFKKNNSIEKFLKNYENKMLDPYSFADEIVSKIICNDR